MIQKVKVDLIADLEEASVEEIDDIEKEVVSPDKEKPARWYSGRRFWAILLIGVAGVMFLLFVSGSIWWMWAQKVNQEARMKREAAEAEAARLARTPAVVNLKDFMISVRDSKGNPRIVVCDVALEFAPNRISPGVESRVDIRNIIYSLAKAKTTDWWQSAVEGQGLKNEIGGRLNALLGAGTVTDVRFTKLEVL